MARSCRISDFSPPTILPAAYQLFNWWNVPSSEGIGYFFQHGAGNSTNWQQTLPDDLYNFFVMAAGQLDAPNGANCSKVQFNSSTGSPPPDLIKTYLWDAGVLPYNVFNALAGWSGFTSSCGGAGTSTGYLCLLGSMINASPYPITVEVTPNHSNQLSWGNQIASASSRLDPTSWFSLPAGGTARPYTQPRTPQTSP